jgi:hypothetical protein
MAPVGESLVGRISYVDMGPTDVLEAGPMTVT